MIVWLIVIVFHEIRKNLKSQISQNYYLFNPFICILEQYSIMAMEQHD